jgi:hypothetical protein
MRTPRQKARLIKKKGFAASMNLQVNQLVEFTGTGGRQRGIIKCLNPFGKVGTVLVKEFLGSDAYIVGINRVEIV